MLFLRNPTPGPSHSHAQHMAAFESYVYPVIVLGADESDERDTKQCIRRTPGDTHAEDPIPLSVAIPSVSLFAGKQPLGLKD